MIISVKADGFRSLRRFGLDLGFGLNVLAGPNGAGKSNILDFFRFVGFLASKPLPEAVSDMGGLPRVFSRLPGGGYRKTVSGAVTGIAVAGADYIRYWYRFKITLAPKTNKLSFSRQSVSLAIWDTKRKKMVEILCIEGSDKKGFTVDKLIASRLGPKNLPTHGRTKPEISSAIEEAVGATTWRSQCILPRLAGILFYAYKAQTDLVSTVIARVKPDVARKPNGFAETPGVGPLGERLAVTLKAIHDETPDSFQRIEQMMQAANSDITNMQVQTDEKDSTLNVWFRLKCARGHEIALPISSMSDGNVKWLVLMTALNWEPTWKNGLIVDELENFLHPWMQQQLITILREKCEAETLLTVLVTTHSETVLNSAKPEEMWVCRMQKGVTCVSKPSNVEQLQVLIRDSGFGLGYFYVAGGLEDE